MSAAIVNNRAGVARYAAPQALEAMLVMARKREQQARAERIWIESALSIRTAQVERGEWPARAHDDDWWASQPKPTSIEGNPS